jgi:hypothetical protein
MALFRQMESRSTEGKGGTAVINANLWIGIFCGVLALFIYFMTRDLSMLGGIYVDFVLAAMGVLSIVMAIRGWMHPELIKIFSSKEEKNNVLIGVVILMVYLSILPVIGFLAASYIFYFCFNLYLADDRFGKANIVRSILLSGVVVTVFYVVFSQFLEVPLPESMWAE